jgi:ribonuclease R
MDHGGWLIYEKKKAREEIFIPFVPKYRPKAQDWVRAVLEFHTQGPHPVTGKILQIFGPDLPPSADLPMIVADYNLVDAHSELAVREAQQKRLDIPGKDLDGRQDLRRTPFITIDGATARDFDDAIFVEKKGEHYLLWVAIADVSHYVQEGGDLDREARSRGTSVYFPERALHMLPAALSENLCSLRPHEPRLAMVAKLEFNANGKRIKTEIMEAVIESQRRATYDEIQVEWEKSKGNSSWIYAAHFELYGLIKKSRTERGSIDFEFPEAELSVEPTGEVNSIKIRPRNDAHRLIEEFMIAANEAVTDWMMTKHWPFVYRIHDEPALKSLENFQALAATVGLHVSLEKARSPKVLATLVRKLEGHPAQVLLNMSLLRAMKQAIYSSTHGIHFGLASEGYTHFTSPIRRYPDLVVHRLLKMALKYSHSKQVLKKHVRDQLEKELAEICEHCSYRERLATDAERDSIKLKQVRVMLDHVGSEFDGKVVGMVSAGLFIQIPDPYVEGMASVESMTDDHYEFNEERMVVFGRRKRKTFHIGDAVRIKVARADIDRRQIEFVMIDLKT